MSFPIEACPITGVRVQDLTIYEQTNPHLIDYFNPIIGRVLLDEQAYVYLFNLEENDPVRNILKGFCRTHFVKYGTAFQMTYQFASKEYKNNQYPKTFKEKSYYFLKYLYENGGSEYKEIIIKPDLDYPLAFSENADEICRILRKLDEDYMINFGLKTVGESGRIMYAELTLTSSGIEKAEELIPNVPMVGLVDQEIRTGNTDTDDKINHAKKLFFNVNSSFEDKRSACETLNYVLEPLRDNLKKYFLNSDVSDFFRMVNDFDIRHNKPHTKEIKTEEQLEWVFYTLLNTITCYSKINF